MASEPAESKPAESTDDERAPKPRARLRRLGWLLALIVLLAATVWWTMIGMPGESYRGELPPADDALTALAEELRRDVAHLAVGIGERNVLNRPEVLTRAAVWIEAQLAAAGYRVNRQQYEVDKTPCHNLEAQISGAARADQIVVIGAHYDTVVGTPGANDNTSGVAALLALARTFSGRQPNRTLRFVAFVNEEPPFFQTADMGSWVYARRCREQNENIVAMLSLETIGYYDSSPGSQEYPSPFGLLYPSTGDFIGFVGNVGSRALVREVVGSFRRHEKFPSEGGALPAFLPGIGFSDHWSFWQEGYPALMVTDTAMFRYPYYHDPEDTLDKVDFQKTARVVRGLEKVVGELAAVRLETN